MGKKGTKRKTQWRTLSITECPQNLKSAITKQYSKDRNSANITSTTETSNNIEGAISQDDDCSNHESSYSNPSYLKRKSSTSSNHNNNNNYRNDYRTFSRYSYNNNKQNSASSTSSLHSSSRYSGYRRRPFSSLQNNSSRYSSYDNERTFNRGHRFTYSASNREDSGDPTKKLHFNEDDYTRISTPRQDVIFKKGCFSQPKKYISSTDTNTTSSAAASIVSAEESVSALSIPSLSPEQCSSIADSLDPEQGFVYSFVDQNGVVYSYVPNGFDQYNGQMMMLPYGYPPYLCSPDVTSPTDSSEESKPNETSPESPKTPPSEINETKVIEEVSQDSSNSIMASSEETLTAQESNDNKDCVDEDKKEECVKEATVTVTETVAEVAKVDKDETKENEEIPDAVQNIPGQFYNYGYPAYYPPQMLYPYMIPQQFVPVFGNEIDMSVEEEYNEEIEDQNIIRYRCRKKRRNTEGNSTGVSAATTDYSDDESDREDSDIEHKEDRIIEEQRETVGAQDTLMQPHETEPKPATTLNVDVEEFVPRAIIKSSLNANVQEFMPRSQKDTNQPIEPSKEESNKTKIRSSDAVESAKSVNSTNIARKPLEKHFEKKRTQLTLAEKIKKSMAEGARFDEQNTPLVEKSAPQRRNVKPTFIKDTRATPNRNLSGRKKSERIVKERIGSPKEVKVAQSSQPSYAQIANGGVEEIDNISSNEQNVQQIGVNPVDELKATTKNIAREPKSVKSRTAAHSESRNNVIEAETSDTWQTVKSRGKRGKTISDRSLDKSLIDDSPASSFSEKIKPAQIVPTKESNVQELSTAVREPKEVEQPSELIVSQIVPSAPEPVTSKSSSSKKTPKTKNRKNTKKNTDNVVKQKKKLEILEPVFQLPKTEKRSSNETPGSTLDDPNDEESNGVDVIENGCDEDTSFSSGETDFTFDRLYLGKGFGRNPMDILKGFDYKYKSKSILKEEEEMVLSVIKSLNSSSASSPPKTGPMSLMIEDEGCNAKVIDEVKYDKEEEDSGSEADTLSESSSRDSMDVKTLQPRNYEVNDDENIEPDSEATLEEMEFFDGKAEAIDVEDEKKEQDEVSRTDIDEETAENKQIEKLSDVTAAVEETMLTEKVDIESTKDAQINVENGFPLSADLSSVLETASDNGNVNVDLTSSKKEEATVPNDQEDTLLLPKRMKNGFVNENGGYKDVEVNSLEDDPKNGNESIALIRDDIQEVLSQDEVNLVSSFQENFYTKNDCQLMKNEVSTMIDKDEENDQSIIKNKNIDLDTLKMSGESKIKQYHANCNGTVNSHVESKNLLNLSKDQPRSVSQFSVQLEVDTPLLHQETLSPNIDGHTIEPLTNGNCESSKLHRNLHEDNISVQNGFASVPDETEYNPKSVKDIKFELNERLMNAVEETPLQNGSSDFTACVNALNTIIRSRECSLEPTSRDNSIEPILQKQLSLEDDVNLTSKSLKSELRLNPADDYLACVNGLNQLIKSRESSQEPQSIENSETTSAERLRNDLYDELNTNGSLSNNDLEKALPANESQPNENSRASIDSVVTSELNQLNLEFLGAKTAQDDLPLNNFRQPEKELVRVLNSSISCDHSSGIGSDCEDNHPMSPVQNEEKCQKSFIPESGSPVAQIDTRSQLKSMFPVKTISSDTNMSAVTHTPPNVLPIYSLTNSVTCDNQSVSYTSSQNTFDANPSSCFPSPVDASDDSKHDQINLSTTDFKFPYHNDASQANRFPLMEAVKQWLVEESKEPSPEPLFRIPENPSLKSLLEKQLKRVQLLDENDSTSTDESEHENDYYDENEDYEEDEKDEIDYLEKHRTNPKNLKSNPLLVSSYNVIAGDSDSDYNSDDHHCCGRKDDNTGERVAKNISDKTLNTLDKNDLLEYWDDEFVSDPKKWLNASNSLDTNIAANGRKMYRRDSNRSKRSPSTDLQPYTSVYGKTIDYNQLQANNYESLSNNILSINQNDEPNANAKLSQNNQAAFKETNESKQSLGSNNGFYKNKKDTLRSIAIKHISSTATIASANSQPHTNQTNENCLKPPEVCCILM